jgi:hypothetical protein
MQSDISKGLIIAVNAALSATQRNDGPCLHLAQAELTRRLEEVDAMVAELETLRAPKEA